MEVHVSRERRRVRILSSSKRAIEEVRCEKAKANRIPGRGDDLSRGLSCLCGNSNGREGGWTPEKVFESGGEHCVNLRSNAQQKLESFQKRHIPEKTGGVD